MSMMLSLMGSGLNLISFFSFGPDRRDKQKAQSFAKDFTIRGDSLFLGSMPSALPVRFKKINLTTMKNEKNISFGFNHPYTNHITVAS